MGHAEMQAMLKRIAKAGEQSTGEKLPRLKQTNRKEKGTRYPADHKWFHAEVKK